MSVLHLVFTTKGGGAGIAAARLHEGLIERNYKSYILTIDDFKKTNIFKNLLIKYLSIILCKLDISSYWFPQSIGLFGQGLVNKINDHQANIVHIHWINQGFLSIKEISEIKKPIVWTLHDEWFYSGSEHYETKGKLVFESIINNEKVFLPKFIRKISFNIRYLLSNIILDYKLSSWSKKSIYVISPSKWALKKLRKSKIKNLICKSLVSENLISSSSFDNEISSISTKIILYVSSQGIADIRKGGFIIKPLIPFIRSLGYQLHIVGDYKNSKSKIKHSHNVFFHGKLKNRDLFLLMTQSSILFHPSLVDNKPNVMIESLLAGCPVITFNSGGQKEIINSKNEGICVENYSVKSFKKAFLEIINSKQNTIDSRNARVKRARNIYGNNNSLSIHLGLYKEIDNV